jgi:hypothetical protein
VAPALTAWVVGPVLTMAKSVAIPLSGIVCGVFGSLSGRISDAPREPMAVGANVMLSTHVALGATVPLQVSVSRKSPGFVPTNEIAPTSSAPDPELVIVTGSAALVLPTIWFGKLRLEGERETTG